MLCCKSYERSAFYPCNRVGFRLGYQLPKEKSWQYKTKNPPDKFKGGDCRLANRGKGYKD